MLERLNAILWGPFMMAALCGAGLYFTIRTGWLSLKLKTIFGATFGTLFVKREKGKISPFGAMATALASCLGTGNIAGVAAALAAGGPGALFWMWVAAFLSMATKYAEVTLAVHYRVKRGGIWRGGPMYYMERGLGLKPLAIGFSAICLVATLGTGNFTQIGAMSEAVSEAFGIPPPLVGFAAMLLIAPALMGGIRGVARVAEKLVPAASLLYISGAVILIAVNFREVIPAFEAIVSGAFGLKPALGGAAGFGLARAMRFGVARGVFSNEAGMGTSPIAHSAADTDSPAKQGLWGAAEVFLDTLVMCTLTGLAILVSGAGGAGAAFATVFGAAGYKFVAVSLSLFAVASVLGWSCYGEACAVYLFGRRRAALLLYRAVYLAAVPLGAVLGMERVWAFADLMNGLMLVPNLAAVAALGGVVVKLTRDTR
ncbi:sodium:alanine symporter [Clostridia bacterium]|nr:sodium:alanine symporter [Clostridia bacterium]